MPAVRLLLTALCILLLPRVGSAQLATDRPGLGFAASTVEPNGVQVEAGLPSATATDRDGLDIQTYRIPVRVRVGLTPSLEVRLSTSLFDAVRVEGDGDGSLGFETVQAGAKLQVRRGEAGGPAIALLGAVQVPAGEDGSAVFAADVAAAWTLPNALGLTTVAGVAARGEAVQGSLVGVLARSLTPRLGGYAEAGAFPSEGAVPVLVGAGVTFAATPTAQLDAYINRGVTDDARDWLFGLGFSFRLR